ncbi:MAG TPA: hypothetical protein VGQ87_03290 [Patescibacteria group bacterium]|jgi:hypothetical protein|nr:hypothetical protein [Patescibacteria group bacterium]
MYWPSLKQHFDQKLFPGQQDGEEIFMVIRQHWITFTVKLAVWLMFVFILLLTDYLAPKYASFLFIAPYSQVWILIKSLYLMFLILGLLMLWVIYYLNVQIITNERVVDITQTSLLHHTISELHLNRIQDVTADVKGILPTFFDYGNVYLQTAGETERFVFEGIPNPTAVEKLILDLYEKLPDDEKHQGHLE